MLAARTVLDGEMRVVDLARGVRSQGLDAQTMGTGARRGRQERPCALEQNIA